MRGVICFLAFTLQACAVQRTPAVEPIGSWRELRDRNVVRQQLDYSCGAAALATLIQYYFGDEVSEEAILADILGSMTAEEVLDREANGLSLLDLRLQAERMGYQAVGVQLNLAALPRLTGPVIVHLEGDDYRHFAVLKGVRGDRIFLADPSLGYTAFVATANQVITTPDGIIETVTKMPQMPTYHLKREDGNGITLVNIGVGPSNAKTATDHIAVLRPHAWLMVGHCAGLRNSQSLGDFVLAHAYLREDHVLDDDLPIWVPIPALAADEARNAPSPVLPLASISYTSILLMVWTKRPVPPLLSNLFGPLVPWIKTSPGVVVVPMTAPCEAFPDALTSDTLTSGSSFVSA